jgi:hypothetical protein
VSTRTIRFPDGSYRQVTLGPAKRATAADSPMIVPEPERKQASEIDRLRRLAERGTPEQRARARKHLDAMGSVW